MSTLMQASEQWRTRPADQRFNSLAALHAAVMGHHNKSVEARNVDLSTLRVTVGETEAGARVPMLESGTQGKRAEFTHYAFGQFSRRLGAPAGYLRTLPAGLACANLNAGLQGRIQAGATVDDEPTACLLFNADGTRADGTPALTLRCATSDKYKRIHNCDITRQLIRLTESSPEWQPAPAAFDGSRGLYASDQDMFAFLVDNDRRIFEKDPGGGFGRGFFVANSEVGDRSFTITTFLYQYVCGNHMVWGAQGVQQIKIRHVGDADSRAFGAIRVELRRYADATAKDQEAKIESMRVKLLGATKDEVLESLFKLGIAQQTARKAVALADEREAWYGQPNTVFAQVSALTEIARDLPHANQRVDLERAAGKVAAIAF